MTENPAVFQPSKKDLETIKYVLESFDYCKRLREKKYPLIGNRTPKQYWDECEKRFVAYAPPKDVTEDDWQANVVMGITRNAVLSQIAKSGLRVPETQIQDWTKDGFMDTERSRIWQNMYRWSLRRENADWMQQFVSLGCYVRGNACLFEGFDDKEVEVEIVEDTDQDTGELKTRTDKVSTWGPRRQIVPLDEIYFPNYFKNELKRQTYVIWARTEDYDSLKVECEGYKNWKKVKPGIWNVPAINDPFFKPRTVMGKRHVFVIRVYGNPWEGGEDRFCMMANGVPLVDGPLPFNHKRPPFSWGMNEPFSDAFMLGCSVPFKIMDQQDTGDAFMNMMIDKNTLSLQKPVMTDDPDARIDNFIYPGSIMRFTKGSTWTVAPIEGVTAGEANFLQTVITQAKEFSGAFGGGTAATSKGGKVSARQAIMQEEEVKRQLGISMSNLEALERDICILRLQNLQQFLPGSGQRIEAEGVKLRDGKRGRFVAVLAKNMREAMRMEKVEHKLSQIEMAGQISESPTEAVAIAPDWFDMTDRLEAQCVSESSYRRNSSLDQSVADERMQILVAMKPLIPTLDAEEVVRANMEKHGEDAERFMSAKPQQPQMPPGQEGAAGGPAANSFMSQMAQTGQEKSLNAAMGTSSM
jgi:hypothetical protein